MGVIASFLDRVRSGLYRHEARRAALYAIAVVAAVALAIPVLGHFLVETRRGALTVLGIGGLAAALVVVGAIVIGVVVPRRRWHTDPELARWIGTRKREVASD